MAFHMSESNSAKLLLETIPLTMRSIRMEMRDVAGKEFTVPQYRLLMRVSREPGSNQDLADWMGVKPPTMSRMVDALVERGLLTREARIAGRDRRLIEIRATEQGRSKAEKVRSVVLKRFEKQILAMSKVEKKELVAGLTLLKKHFKVPEGKQT